MRTRCLATDRSERLLPQLAHAQHKPRQHRSAAERGWVVQRFHRLAGAVDIRPRVEGINQPAEARAVVEVLPQLLIQAGKAIRWRAEFHNEIGTQGRSPLLLFLSESIPPVTPDPRSIRRAFGAVRK